MVIQRIQSLYLLLASIVMILLSFVFPILRSTEPSFELYIVNVPELLVINLVTALLLLVDIFLFKHLRLQMKVARISTVMIVLSALFEAYVIFGNSDGEAKWIGSAIMLVVAFVFVLLALKGMKHDYNALNYNRIR